MTTTIRTAIAAAVATLALGAAQPADARTNAHMLEACEDAIRTELGDGHTRIRRVRSIEDGGAATFWLTVRHKIDTADKSERFRALCEVDSDAGNPSVSLESGWWRKGRRGQAPEATD